MGRSVQLSAPKKESSSMKRWGLSLVFAFTMVLSGKAEAGPSALELGYCAADFETCYNGCRIAHPDSSFASDRARVICGQQCFQTRRQCEARAGVVRPAPAPAPIVQPRVQPPLQPTVRPQLQPAAPTRTVRPTPQPVVPQQPLTSPAPTQAPTQAPRQATGQPTALPRAQPPGGTPMQTRPTTVQQAPAAAAGSRPVPRSAPPSPAPTAAAAPPPPPKSENSFWDFIKPKPRERKKSRIPGKL